MHRVLVCAATRAEHDACKRGLLASARSDREMLFTGVGPHRAARSLDERLSRGALPDLVVSSGFAGALSPTIALSSWVTASRVVEWNDGARVPVLGVELVEGPPGLLRCEVVSSSTLLSSKAAGLTDDGAEPLVVDMESAALAREAARRGVAFAVVRLVSDTPAKPLPSFLAPFAAAMAATNTSSRVALAGRGIRQALADPRGLLALATEGPEWLRQLEAGWQTLAFAREG